MLLDLGARTIETFTGGVASYSVRIKTAAAKELEGVQPKRQRERIASRIRALGREPYPPGSQTLAGSESRFRICQGRYRVGYSVDDDRMLVEVVKIGHRENGYR